MNLWCSFICIGAFLAICIVEYLFCFEANAQTEVYCQGKTQLIQINDKNEQFIIYTRNKDDANYKDNMECKWKIETNPNYRIQLYDFDVDVQFVPDYSTCNQYDYLQIDEVNGDDEHTLATICHNVAYKYILSAQNKLSIEFKSNFAINAKGIRFSVRVWDSEIDCPPEWFKSDDDKCFTLYNENTKSTLKNSQAHCNLAQSNLASFMSKTNLDNFINTYLAKYNANMAWIGLNDVETKNSLKWLENSPLSFNSSIYTDPENVNENCIALELLEKTKNQTAQRPYQFTRLPCDTKTLKLPFICKMNQKGSTQLYQLPLPKSLKDVHDSAFNIFLRIGFPILAVLIGLCLILLICYSAQLGRSCSKSNLFAARLSTFIICLVLTIAFITLFVLGILARSKIVLSIGLPVLVLVFLTIVVLIYIKIRDRSDSSNEYEVNRGNESELETLKGSSGDDKQKNTSRNELPSYDQAISN